MRNCLSARSCPGSITPFSHSMFGYSKQNVSSLMCLSNKAARICYRAEILPRTVFRGVLQPSFGSIDGFLHAKEFSDYLIPSRNCKDRFSVNARMCHEHAHDPNSSNSKEHHFHIEKTTTREVESDKSSGEEDRFVQSPKIWSSRKSVTYLNVEEFPALQKSVAMTKQEVTYENLCDPENQDLLQPLVEHDPPRSAGNTKWFPLEDRFDLGLAKVLTSDEVIELLGPFVAEERKNRMKSVAAGRTYQTVPVVEGLADLGNISAVSRTADALGMQSMHVISNLKNKKYKDNRRISKGTGKWLDVETWETSIECFEVLRSQGYRIAVTHLSADTVPIYELDWTIPTAVVFGNEHEGASKEALLNSDIRVSIPMAGMVDSFNISVAAAITLHQAVQDRIRRQGCHGDLSDYEKHILYANFLLRGTRHTTSIIERLLSEEGASIGQKKRRSYITKAEGLDVTLT